MEGRLTGREIEVLTLAAGGLTYKEIATRLGISTRTARNHLTHIYGKMGIHDRAGAALCAVRLGLIEASPAEARSVPAAVRQASPPIEA